MATLPFPIASTQTDAKSPIDAQLMDAIRLNQEYLCTQVGGASGGGIINFKVNGYLTRIKALLEQGAGKYLDGGPISAAVTFAAAKLYLEKAGDSGTLEVDVLRHLELQHSISDIAAQYSGNTQSIGRLGSPLNTQSISLATPSINTLQIDRAKATLDVETISNLGNDLFLYVFDGTTLLDTDYAIGDSITFSGCTNAGNDGTYIISSVNYDGLPSVVVTNASGVQEIASPGTGNLDLFSFTFAASVNAEFSAGEKANLTGHTDGVNNGSFDIFKINQGGNNIWFKIAGGQTQGGAAGSVQCNRFLYSYGAAIDATQYIVGEKAEFSGHTSAVNDGQFNITAVVGSSITVYNDDLDGTTQGGAAGTSNTLRWLYAMNVDPTTDSNVQVGDGVTMSGHSSAVNDGIFTVTFVNRFAVNNIEVYNPAGIVQGGVAGLTLSNKRLVKFKEDFSASYLAGTSKVALEGIANLTDTDGREYDVIEINRGGFSNFNVVIDSASGVGVQTFSQGRVAREVRTIFIDRPKIEVEASASKRFLQKTTTATFAAGGVPADSILTMDILQVPEGLPSTMTLSLS